MRALPLTSTFSAVTCDPFVPAEVDAARGDLLVHYAVPLIEGASVYMTFKSGAFTGADTWGTQSWGVRKLTWVSGALLEQWTFTSDWKPVPASLAAWEPVFQPVLAAGFLVVPASAGSVFRVSKTTGAALARVDPLPPPPAGQRAYVGGGLAADASGAVWYTALTLDENDEAAGSWLVRVAADGTPATVSYATLVPDAPAAMDPCELSFASADLPWPPSAGATPRTFRCGAQRAALNAVPAIAPDGTVYTITRAHDNARYAYLVAAHADLTPAWAASLRNRLNDGCDVLVPASGTPGGCRAGSTRGVDPATNAPPAGQVLDSSTSSPVVLPDGSVLYGAYTRYNSSRGHLFRFDANGNFTGSYDFGWDVTPAVFSRGGSYSILLKDNHYAIGSYCGTAACPPAEESYDLVSLDAALAPEWKFTSTNTLSCERASDGSVTCVSDHPRGFEWCINQPAVDSAGVLYANSEDGFLYAVAAGGILLDKTFLDRALGAAYTPVAIGPDGIVYAQNAGRLFAIGNAARSGLSRPPRRGPPRFVEPR